MIQKRIHAATSAGLRYVTDTDPGITRRRAGRGYRYLDPKGQPIRDEETVARLRALVIPPAWTEVWICPSADGHIQVTARDTKGRKQYRYHPRYRAVRDETKFTRLIAFSRKLPRLRRRVERDLRRRGLPRDRVLATVVWLLEKTFFRIGNDQYARDNKSFGLTTLRRRHVAVTGSEVRFEFRGKSGVRRAGAITDARIARIVQRCQTLPGEELFQYLDEDGHRWSVDSGDINDYLRRSSGGWEATAKDFRTWAGTVLAATALREYGPVPTERQAKANIVRAVDHVAQHLGNTRAVCRRYYIHPLIIDAYHAGRVIRDPEPSDEPRKSGTPLTLRADEAAVVEFLLASSAGAQRGRQAASVPDER